MTQDRTLAAEAHDALWAVLWSRRYDDIDEPVWQSDAAYSGILAFARPLDDATGLAAVDIGEAFIVFASWAQRRRSRAACAWSRRRTTSGASPTASRWVWGSRCGSTTPTRRPTRPGSHRRAMACAAPASCSTRGANGSPLAARSWARSTSRRPSRTSGARSLPRSATGSRSRRTPPPPGARGWGGLGWVAGARRGGGRGWGGAGGLAPGWGGGGCGAGGGLGRTPVGWAVLGGRGGGGGGAGVGGGVGPGGGGGGAGPGGVV